MVTQLDKHLSFLHLIALHFVVPILVYLWLSRKQFSILPYEPLDIELGLQTVAYSLLSKFFLVHFNRRYETPQLDTTSVGLTSLRGDSGMVALSFSG